MAVVRRNILTNATARQKYVQGVTLLKAEGSGTTKLEQAVTGRGERIRLIRDRLLAEGRIVNKLDVDGVTHALNHCPERRAAHLYLADHPDVATLPRSMERPAA